MGEMITIGLVFTAGFLVVVFVDLVTTDLFRRDMTNARRMEEELRRQRDAPERRGCAQGLSELAEEAREETGRQRGLRQRFRELTEQSGLNLSPGDGGDGRGASAVAAAAALFTQSVLVEGGGPPGGGVADSVRGIPAPAATEPAPRADARCPRHDGAGAASRADHVVGNADGGRRVQAPHRQRIRPVL